MTCARKTKHPIDFVADCAAKTSAFNHCASLKLVRILILGRIYQANDRCCEQFILSGPSDARR